MSLQPLIQNTRLALADDLRTVWRARALLWTLTRRDISARHAGTAGGWVWAFAQPVLMVAAYYLVFDVVFAMRLGENAPTRAVGAFLVVGALPWLGFCDALNRGAASLVDAGSLLQKNPLPAALFPARSVLATACIHVPLLLALCIAYTPMHRFNIGLLSVFPLMLLQWVLTFLLAWLLAIFAAAIRDTLQVLGFLLAVGIFLSPILFPMAMFPSDWQWVLWLNPMSSVVIGYQAILLQGHLPPISTWAVGLLWLVLVATILSTVVRRSRDQLVDWL